MIGLNLNAGPTARKGTICPFSFIAFICYTCLWSCTLCVVCIIPPRAQWIAGFQAGSVVSVSTEACLGFLGRNFGLSRGAGYGECGSGHGCKLWGPSRGQQLQCCKVRQLRRLHAQRSRRPFAWLQVRSQVCRCFESLWML